MVKTFIIDNPVEEYFKIDENKTKCLSVKTLSNRLNIRKKAVYFYINNSDKFECVRPLEVGSLAYKSRVFRYKSNI